MGVLAKVSRLVFICLLYTSQISARRNAVNCRLVNQVWTNGAWQPQKIIISTWHRYRALSVRWHAYFVPAPWLTTIWTMITVWWPMISAYSWSWRTGLRWSTMELREHIAWDGQYITSIRNPWPTPSLVKCYVQPHNMIPGIHENGLRVIGNNGLPWSQGTSPLQ